MRIRVSAKIHTFKANARHERQEHINATLIYIQCIVDVLNILADLVTLIACAELVV